MGKRRGFEKSQTSAEFGKSNFSDGCCRGRRREGLAEGRMGVGRTELARLELELVEALGAAGFLGHPRRHRSALAALFLI
jgi:hypothetical protein